MAVGLPSPGRFRLIRPGRKFQLFKSAKLCGSRIGPQPLRVPPPGFAQPLVRRAAGVTNFRAVGAV